ncbi:glycoside hydrolase family 19 protein [Nocardia aurantia]|uniref:glycoside hydrolase family 19 protein n=1 Tax=Nocardia aurantia TaxID=2585199 RepID=UPI0029E8069D|nr:glycoside hydrolase family 19 protein [Nocardia aurantia]
MTPPRMPPPRSVIEAWRALEAALGLRALFDRSLGDMESLSGAVRAECRRLDGGGWRGTAYDAVLDHVEAAHRRNQLLWDQLEALRDRGAGALTDLHYTALAALDYAADAEAAGCTVADDWTVTAEHPAVAGEWSEVLAEALTAVTRAADRGRAAILGVSNEFRCLAAMFGLHTAVDLAAGESPEAGATTPAPPSAGPTSTTGPGEEVGAPAAAELSNTGTALDTTGTSGSIVPPAAGDTRGIAGLPGAGQVADPEENDGSRAAERTDDAEPALDPVAAGGSGAGAEISGRTTAVEDDRSSGTGDTSDALTGRPPEPFGGNDIRPAGLDDESDGVMAVSRSAQGERDATGYVEPGDLNSIDLRSGDPDESVVIGPEPPEEAVCAENDSAVDRFADEPGDQDETGAEPPAADECGIGTFGIAAATAWHTGPATGPAVGVTLDQLTAIMPDLSFERAAEYLPALNAAMLEGGITTPLRQAAFLAQLAHESGQLRYFEEFGDDGYFRQYDPGQPNAAAGNTAPGDGPLFHGRGPIQLTGRGNYRDAGLALGLDLEGDPGSAARPDIGFRVAQWYWNSRAINALADLGDFSAVTAAVNGGYNGLAERESFYRRALEVLG